MTTAQQTFTEMLDSLTGHEENAIEARFGADIYTLLGNATKAGRALVFTSMARAEGAEQGRVFNDVMGMTIRQVNDFWTEDPDEVVPEEPSTEVGKGSGAPTSKPKS